MAILWNVRFVSFAVTLLFSVIMLGVSGGLISENAKLDFGAPNYAVLGVVVALLSMLTIGPMLAIDLIRRGAITSWIVIELSVLGVLWILWLSAGASAANVTDGITIDCGTEIGSIDNNRCHLYQAIEAFGFITWLILLGYWITLLVFTVRAHIQGNMTVWQGTVRDTDFSNGSTGNGPDVPMTATSTGVEEKPQPYASVPTMAHV